LDVDLTNYTYTAAAGTLELKLAAGYIPTFYEELELIYRNFGGGPLTVDASGAGGLCTGTIAGDPSLAPGLANEVIRLRYSNGTYRVVGRYGLDVEWNTLDIIDSLDRPISVTTVNSGSYPLLDGRCAARIDSVATASPRAIIGGSYTAFSPFSGRLAIGYFDGAQVWAFAAVPSIASSVIMGIHMYSASDGLAGVSSSSGVADKVLVTTDGGDIWTAAGDLPIAVGTVDGVVGGYNSSTRMLIAYCKDAYDRIFVSTDGGTTWLAETLPLATDRLKAITHVNSTNKQFIAVGHDGSLHGRIWRRSVAAAGSGVWSLVMSDGAVSTIVQDVSYDMAVGDSGRVWFTVDDGATWTQRPVVRTTPGGYTADLKQVRRGLASGRRVYYAHLMYNDVGFVAVSLNTGRDFYGRGAFSYGSSGVVRLDIVGGSGGNLAMFPESPFGFTVFQRPPSGDRTRLQ
jgi:hypothetical protein